MPSSAVNICVLTLVLLSFQQTCHSRPHRTERGLVKDYFTPDSLLFTSDKFEKGDDGKYYLKKSAHLTDSEVKYSSPDDEKKEKSDESETATDKSDVQTESSKNEPLIDGVPPDVLLSTAIAEETKVNEEIKSTPKAESIVEEISKEVKTESEKAPFTPVDPKFEIQPKPDSKDELPLKTELPEDKVDEKISIGEVSDLYSRLVPIPGTFRVPILIPVRQVAYESVKVMPLPTAGVSDRLPLPYEDDIIGEGAHESESEGVSEPITEEKKDGGYHPGNPLISRLPMPGLGLFLKDLKEADKRTSDKQSKVVDVLGKKFLMQSNVMKYPTSDNSHLYLRFLSVKPLEEVKPIVPKEIESEDISFKGVVELEKKEESIATEAKQKEKNMEFEIEKEKSIEAEIAKEKSIDSEIAKEKSIESEIEKKKNIESEIKEEKSLIESEMKKEEEFSKEPEILKVEETKIKVNVEQEVPKEIILQNMGGYEEKIEESEKEEFVESSVDEMKILNMEHSVAATEELNPIHNTEEKLKTKSEVVEMETESELKDESESKESGEESEMKAMEDEKLIFEETKEKEVEAADALMKKEDVKKEVETANKKDLFLIEKKKKFIEESEKVKTKKTNKKKKCKCEEKDSDSEDGDD